MSTKKKPEVKKELTPEQKAEAAKVQAQRQANRQAAEQLLREPDESTTAKMGWRLDVKPGMVLMLSVYPFLQIKLRGRQTVQQENEKGQIERRTKDKGKIAEFKKHVFYIAKPEEDLEKFVHAPGYGNDFVVVAELRASLRGEFTVPKGFSHVYTRSQARAFVTQLCRRAELARLKLDPVDVITEVIGLPPDHELVERVLELKKGFKVAAEQEQTVFSGQG